jgi:hypothetical protein
MLAEKSRRSLVVLGRGIAEPGVSMQPALCFGRSLGFLVSTYRFEHPSDSIVEGRAKSNKSNYVIHCSHLSTIIEGRVSLLTIIRRNQILAEMVHIGHLLNLGQADLELSLRLPYANHQVLALSGEFDLSRQHTFRLTSVMAFCN